MAARVLGVLGGRDFDPAVLRHWLAWAEIVYAADSGADRCLEQGARPIVVGDFDSFKSSTEGLEVRVDIDEDRSDADKLFNAIRSDGFSAATIIGLEGDRLDHVLCSLSSAASSGLAIRIALRRGLAFVGCPKMSFGTIADQRLSVIPLPHAIVTIRGVKWPLTAETLEYGIAESLSNRATGPITFEVHEGRAMIVIEQDPTADLHSW